MHGQVTEAEVQLTVASVDSSGQQFWRRLSNRKWPLVVVASVASWSLWSIRAALLPVPYLDDASVHEQMVRYATRLIQLGHDPLTGWFPYLGEGSPQFLHYQSLGAMITGLAGTVVGADTAFRWSLFLLVGLWPFVIYLSARLLNLAPWAAAAAGALSPLLTSVPSVGYERGAYLWIGYGLWAQLWASWTLPLAWALSWRGLDDSRYLAPAALLVALTIGLHYETGYLALLAIVVLPFCSSPFGPRIRRAVILVTSALVASSFAWLPLIVYGRWAAINQVLQNTPLENGYGARRTLSWLVSGQVYDAGRFPVISLLVLVGVAVSIRRWRSQPLGRALVALWSACLLLSFGRTTFGPLTKAIPGASDLFFRRFLMGVQLTGLFLAGLGFLACVTAISHGVRWVSDRIYQTDSDRRIGRCILFGMVGILAVGAIFPAATQISRFDARNSLEIRNQRASGAMPSRQISPLIAYIKSHGGGRTYAGLPNNWGSRFTVGTVPVFKYLENEDVDEVGYTLRTASLMTDAEYYFDQTNSSDYTLFGIRYLLLPSGMSPPIPAAAVLANGPFRLWSIRSNGYLDVLETIGSLRETRADIASTSLGLLRSDLILHHEDLSVRFAGTSPIITSKGRRPPPEAPGEVTSGPISIANGTARGEVRLTRPAIVMLSASYDPGWQVTVDGRMERTCVLAPAVVGVFVTAGTHDVVFTYRGFSYYRQLILVGILAILILLGFTWRRRAVAQPEPTTMEGASAAIHFGQKGDLESR